MIMLHIFSCSAAEDDNYTQLFVFCCWRWWCYTVFRVLLLKMMMLRVCVTAPVAGRVNTACNDVDMPCTVPHSACVDGYCVCNEDYTPTHEFSCCKFSHQTYLRLCITDAVCRTISCKVIFLQENTWTLRRTLSRMCSFKLMHARTHIHTHTHTHTWPTPQHKTLHFYFRTL